MLRNTFIILVVLLQWSTAFAQDTLPVSINRQAAALEKDNNLTDWLYLHMDYAAEDPAARLSILMQLKDKAWRKPRFAGEHAAWLDMLTFQGYYQMYTGNILPSITAYENAYRYFNEQQVTDADVLEYILKPLGNNYTRLGDYERAAFIQQKSLEVAQQQQNPVQIAAVYSNLTVTSLMQEQFESAKSAGLKGLQYAPPRSSIAGLLHSSLADVYIQTGQVDSAALHAAAGLDILQQASLQKTENTGYWLSSVQQANGDVAFLRKEYKAASQWYDRSLHTLDQFYPTARNREKARILVKSGKTALAMKQPALAFEKALSFMLPEYKGGWPKETYEDFTLADAIEGRADALVQAGKLQEAIVGYQLIFEIEASLRREFFSRTTRLLHQKHSHALAEKALSATWRLWQQEGKQEYAAAMLNIMEKSKARVLMQEQEFNLQQSRLRIKDTLLNRQRQLQQAIALYDREAAMSGKKNPARDALAYDLSQVQLQIRNKYPEAFTQTERSALARLNKIPPALTVKNIFAGEEHLYVLDIDNSGINSIRRLENGKDKQDFIRDFVTGYFHKGAAAMQNNPAGYYRDAYKIYQWLWNDTIRSKQYLVIPDGWFGYLPFDALLTDSVYKRSTTQWPFVLKRTVTSLAYSLETWLQQKSSADNKTSRINGFFIATEGLPAVEQEYQAVSRAGAGNFYRDGNATLANFRAQLGNGGILHLSTHATLEGAQQLPAIQFADGPFYLFELYNRKFQPGLIVLSACRTGQGMMARGEGILSLAREFTTSGATGIVAGLWNVHDETVAALTGDFYNQLSQNTNPALALHHAKNAWLQNTTVSPQLKLPYYWAAMTYIGHPQPILLEKPGNRYKWYWLTGIVLLIGLFVIGWKLSK